MIMHSATVLREETPKVDAAAAAAAAISQVGERLGVEMHPLLLPAAMRRHAYSITYLRAPDIYPRR
jgi:hypothetical protein